MVLMADEYENRHKLIQSWMNALNGMNLFIVAMKHSMQERKKKNTDENEKDV